MLDLMLNAGVGRHVGWTLLEFVWQGTLVGLGTAALLWLLAGASSSTRYLVALCGLVVVLVWPAVNLASRLDTAPAGRSAAVPSEDSPARVDTAPSGLAPSLATRGGSPVRPDLAGAVDRWAPTIATVWLVGVVLLTARLLGGWLVVERLRSRDTRPLPREWTQRVDRLIDRVRVSRPVRVVESAIAEVPSVVGTL